MGAATRYLGWPLLFLVGLRITAAVALALDGDDLGMMGEAVDHRDGAAGVGKDRVPLLNTTLSDSQRRIPLKIGDQF